ncbi:Translation initiation factor IF-2 [Hyella patelloides LEGE 07179]|uniref:Translation initiation factor IF-2 n=1 Tax=Hyella patelloides LEGE 07179 TaxID=945734 RepID=A0A563VQ05_9CYAN|nr:translation initiation factor IF-2 [Hyella patelloides]VEP13491.1 Translation initiation factor IF-2 [Hyella patelloides LEGE 07179]
MNNGKIRIYELSKELNLENKDIKDICEQLNIAVKSHSSTITDSQAERVRAIAVKYTPETAAKNSVKHQNNSRNKGKRKPQILAIHHRNNSPEAKKKIQTEANSTPTLAGPPKLPTQTPSAPPKKTSVSPKAQLAAPPKVTAKTSSSQSISADSSAPESSSSEKAVAETKQLVAPPPRPQLSKPAAKSNKVLQLSKKPAKVENRSKSTETTSQEGKSPDKGNFAAPKKPKTLAAPPLPKLQKPPKIQNSEPEQEVLPDDQEDAAILDNDEIDLDVSKRKPKKEKLKRPNPPRKVKAKTWEDGDEDTLEQKNKAGTKGKRRPKPIVDDDDDEFDTAFETAATSTAISLSIARPPKPQALQTQKPAAATAKKKPKKSSPRAEKTSKAERRNRQVEETTPEMIELTGSLTVRELSDLLNTPETDIIRSLFFKGIAVNITQTLDLDTARLVAEELGVAVDTPEAKSAATKETEMLNEEDLDNLVLRPPVVTIMGHVDHGKTTLLDSIRKSKVAQGEAGGITQHIGAYHVDIEHEGKEQQIVFLDTPGHEAFTAMRARGTRVTDIAVLVVAADDGVQPQTKEAISHAKAAEVPLIVAINKVDKPEANPDRIKQELTEQGLVPEDWGGDTTMVPVSALKGENLDELLEMIVLVSEIEELSANPNRTAKGTVIEAHLDRTRGPVATLLVQNGTLRVGDSIVAGSVFGKIRAMVDDRGHKVEAASPSFAVEILGLGEVPEAGDEFDVYLSEKEARAVADANAEIQRDSRLQQAMSSRRVSLSTLSAQAQEGELKELNLILKADVQGSVEAILGSLQQLPQNEVQIRVLLASPGEVTETDVDLAAASGAVIIGFNTTLASGSRQAADNEGVDIRQYNIIYKLLDDIQGAMEGLLDPEEVEEALGQVEVRAVFNVGRGAVAGCYVQSGKVIRNCQMRVRRGNKVIYEGNLDSLKRMKEDSREVSAGYECGIGSAKFNDWQEGDIIEAYEMVFKRRTLATK